MAEPSELIRMYRQACVFGDLERVKKCVEKGVDVNDDHKGMSSFRLACEKGYQEIVEYLIEHGADVAIPDRCDGTGLISASMYGHTKIIEMLLAQNSSISFIRTRDRFGNTALMRGAIEGHEDVVRLLLHHEPSEGHILMENKDGRTAIDMAKTEEISELLRFPPMIETKRAKPSF